MSKVGVAVRMMRALRSSCYRFGEMHVRGWWRKQRRIEAALWLV